MDARISPLGTGNLDDYETTYREFTWASADKSFAWSTGGRYNVAAEAIDRHAENWRKNKIALYSIRADSGVCKLTFNEMAKLTSSFASGLEKLGAAKGDRVLVYLDRIPELYISVVGIAKMGGIAGPLFSALGPEAVKDRALDCSASIIVTSPYLYQRLEPVLDELLDVKKFILVGGDEVLDVKTIRFDEVLESGDPGYLAMNMAPTDPYIIHYTSGSVSYTHLTLPTN